MSRIGFALLLSLLFVTAACTGSGNTNQGVQTFVGGVVGLGLSFGPGQPPPEVFDDGQSTFSVGLFIENLGESAIGVGTNNPYGYVEIIGINPSNYDKFDYELRQYWQDIPLTLYGARRGYDGAILPGDIDVVQFDDFSYVIDRVGNSEATIRANVCYEYRTYADAEICFKDNVIESLADDTICTLTGEKPFQTSGAPVQVTSVRQNPAGRDKIQVTFSVENVGTGLVFAPKNANPPIQIYSDNLGENACQVNINANPNRDVVFVGVSLGDDGVYGSTYDIDCPILRQGTNYGYVTLFQGAPAVISCNIRTEGRDGTRVFTDSLNIELAYNYLDFIETPMLIRDTNIGLERGLE